MLTAIAQLVEISTLKTSACLPIQIRIRRSTSGQTVRLRNAIASASQTSAVDRRCWRALPRYVTCAPMLIGQHEHIDWTISANSPTRRTNGFCGSANNRQPRMPYQLPSRDKVRRTWTGSLCVPKFASACCSAALTAEVHIRVLGWCCVPNPSFQLPPC